jgi:hypothetical protein
MPVIDNRNQQCIGYLSDISAKGFKLDSRKTVQINSVYALRLDLPPEISNRANIGFFARAMWSQPDPVNPDGYVHGFQVVNIRPDENAIFQRIVEKYSRS